MKRTLRAISISLIICLAASACLAQDRIKTKITMTPDSWLPFENWFGIETPVIEQKFKLSVRAAFNDMPVEYVKIVSAEDFKLLDGPKAEYDDAGSISYTYILRAPKTEGIYKIEFESRAGREELIKYSTEINVVKDDPKQNWLRMAIWGGMSLAVVGIALAISGTGK